MDLAQKPVYKLDLAAGTSVVNLTTPLVEGDDRAQTFTLELTDKGAPANLNGYSVTAYFGRGKTVEAEADTIPVPGTVSGNVAMITLTESCYSRSCYFSMPVRLSNGATGQKRTYLIVRGTVVKSVDGKIIDPDGSVPSLDDLFAQIAVMERSRQAAEEATEEALAAKDKANAAAVYAVNIATEKGDQAIQLAQEEADKQNVKIAALTKDIARNTAPAIIPTATGSIVSITDGAARPAVEVISHIEPLQEGSGNPSPNNKRPISGWTKLFAYGMGKNLIPYPYTITSEAVNGIKPTVQEDGGIRFSGMATDNAFFILQDGTRVKKGVTYTLSGCKGGSEYTYQLYTYDGLEAYAPNGAASSTAKRTGTCYIGFVVYKGCTVDTTIYPQLVVGSAATPYEVGSPLQTLTATLPETVYGGDKNWTTGELMADSDLIAFTGREPWEISNPGGENYFFHTSIGNYGDVVNDSGLCSHYPSGKVGSDNTDVGVRVVNMAIGYAGIAIRPEKGAYSTADAFKAYLASQYAAGTPVQVAYKLTTSRTIQLTPKNLETLKGINNVWSNCGDTTLSYVADTKSYIDQRIAALLNV